MLTPKLIYLDNNATTPMRPEVLKAMEPFYKQKYGNCASLHQKGREAHAALERSRTVIGDFLGTEAVDIIFTSGGTESDNLAVKGVCLKHKDKGNHIITSSIEHWAVLQACRSLEAQGFEVTYLPVDRYGMVDAKDVQRAISDMTILVTIMHANNEVGTIQPIEEISKVIKNTKKRNIYFHTDAVQSFGKVPVDVETLGVDLLSISGHKIYGPKGVGALYIRKGVEILPLFHGGHHERNLRAGTENVPAVVGFAKAVELAHKDFKDNMRLERLRDDFYRGLLEKIDDIVLNGHPTQRLPNTLSVGFPQIDGESLFLNLDLKGIAASTGSACTSGSIDPSHVLTAMGVPETTAKATVRFSLGRWTESSDIDYCIEVIPDIVRRLRAVSLNPQGVSDAR